MIIVVGVGNRLRKDDCIGVRIVEELKKEMKTPEIEFLLGETVPENLIKKINDLKPKKVFIIDAVDFSGNSGDIIQIENQKEYMRISFNIRSDGHLFDFIKNKLSKKFIKITEEVIYFH